MRDSRIAHHAVRVLLLLHTLLTASYLAVWAFGMDEGMLWRTDFTAFYTGWRIARDGQTGHLYDFEVQRRYQQQILDGRQMEDGLLPYLNPPQATLVFLPLAGLPLVPAFRLWTLLQVGLLAATLWLLYDLARDWDECERLLLITTFLAFPPLIVALSYQAFSQFGLVSLLLLRRALRRDRAALVGAALALGSLKPQLVLLPGLALLAARRWRALAATALLGSFLAALTTAVLGWQSWGDFLGALREVGGYFGVHGVAPSKMYNLRGTLALLLGDGRGELINELAGLGLALAVAALLPCWRGPWQPERPDFDLRFGLTVLLGLLSSLHLHVQDGLLFALPLALGYAALRQRPGGQVFGAFALACPLLFWVGELTVGPALGVRIPTLLMGGVALWLARAIANQA